MTGTVGALAYLTARTARNRAARVISRLRNPRYVAALIAGIVYFGWIFGSPFRDESTQPDGGGLVDFYPWIEGLAPLPIVLLAVLWWTTGRYHTALAFSPPEVHFLFSAPLTRRQLIGFKLAKRQWSVAITVILSCLYFWVLRDGDVTGGRLLRTAGALWVVVTTLQLHQIGASLARAAAAEQGRAGLRRHGIAFLIFAGAMIVVGAALARAMVAALASPDLERALLAVDTALAEPSARAVLLPLRWLLAPLFADTTGGWLGALPGAFLMLGLHSLWVVKSDASFEEGAAEAGRAQAERWRARRQGRGGSLELASLRTLPRPWFKLAPKGHPAVAILWKNLTLAARQVRPTLAVILGIVFAGAYIGVRTMTGDPQEAAATCMAMAFSIAGLTVVTGSLGVRNDLRADLKRLDLLRTYPLSGRDVVAAEVAASTLLLTALQLAFFALGLVFLLLAYPSVQPWWLLAGIGAALLLLPPVNALLVGAQNTLAVLFPAWTQMGADRPGGIEQTGMFTLTLLATLLFLALALLPPVAFALGIGVRVMGSLGVWTALPAGIAAWLVLWGEVALLVVLLGEQYDELDPSEVGLLE